MWILPDSQTPNKVQLCVNWVQLRRSSPSHRRGDRTREHHFWCSLRWGAARVRIVVIVTSPSWWGQCAFCAWSPWLVAGSLLEGSLCIRIGEWFEVAPRSGAESLEGAFDLLHHFFKNLRYKIIELKLCLDVEFYIHCVLELQCHLDSAPIARRWRLRIHRCSRYQFVWRPKGSRSLGPCCLQPKGRRLESAKWKWQVTFFSWNSKGDYPSILKFSNVLVPKSNEFSKKSWILTLWFLFSLHFYWASRLEG